MVCKQQNLLKKNLKNMINMYIVVVCFSNRFGEQARWKKDS